MSVVTGKWEMVKQDCPKPGETEYVDMVVKNPVYQITLSGVECTGICYEPISHKIQFWCDGVYYKGVVDNPKPFVFNMSGDYGPYRPGTKPTRRWTASKMVEC